MLSELASEHHPNRHQHYDRERHPEQNLLFSARRVDAPERLSPTRLLALLRSEDALIHRNEPNDEPERTEEQSGEEPLCATVPLARFNAQKKNANTQDVTLRLEN